MIRGGERLTGTVSINGSKNSAVAVIAAAILSDAKVTIDNLPDIHDVYVMADLLRELGATVQIDDHRMIIDSTSIVPKPLHNGNVKKLRASYYLMGALLGKFGDASIGLPGGCNLGPRPIDQHLKGFQNLGAEILSDGGFIRLKANQLIGNRVFLDTVSVGATINIMLAAAKAEGITTIENAAKEPEIIDVATILNSMGAKITGAGTDVIKILGSSSLHGSTHTIIPDRIEAGTYMIIAAATEGDITVEHVIPQHLESLTAKLRELGAIVEEQDESIRVLGQSYYKPVDVKTFSYPGFPTDLQQPFSVLLTKAQGTSMMVDHVFPFRFHHIDELRRMGAKLKVEGEHAIIEGPVDLQGATVKMSDIRSGAALIVAGLTAQGTTQINDVHHIDRGYENLEKKLSSLGANIWRLFEDDFL